MVRRHSWRYTAVPEADDHKESLHFFSNNQQIIVHLIKNRNKLPAGALTDDVLDTSNTTYALTFHVTPIVSIGERVRFHIKSLRLKGATGQFRQQ
jgi:hypothetical protein